MRATASSASCGSALRAAMTEFLQLFFAADELGLVEFDGLAVEEGDERPMEEVGPVAREFGLAAEGGDEKPMEEVGLVARGEFDVAARDVTTSDRCPPLEYNESFCSRLGDA